mmetsp:Transcript_9393/g.15615  ORF Transcript_9393/g.15615 Transcript_9393/m.15615 type:complete len:281 (+) Transcript_9393:115-957(+)
MASKEKPAEQPMASCRSSFTSFVRDLLLGMIIAAFVLVYGTFGMSKHHHQHGGAASNEDDYHYVASLSSSTHIKPAFRSLLKFVGDGCLGLAVATSVLAYGAFSKLVGSMTVVVNGTDYSCVSSSKRSTSQEIRRTSSHHQTPTKHQHTMGRPNKGVPCQCSRRFPQHVLSCTKSVCMRAGCVPLRAGERLLLRNKETLSRCQTPDQNSCSSSWSSTLTPIIEERDQHQHQPHQHQAEKMLYRRLNLPASLRFAGAERPQVGKSVLLRPFVFVAPVVKRY